jgi:hypothetical protein
MFIEGGTFLLVLNIFMSTGECEKSLRLDQYQIIEEVA